MGKPRLIKKQNGKVLKQNGKFIGNKKAKRETWTSSKCLFGPILLSLFAFLFFYIIFRTIFSGINIDSKSVLQD